MNPLDILLTSLVDSVFPVMRDKPDNLDYPPRLCLLNPIVYGRREAEDSHGKFEQVLPL